MSKDNNSWRRCILCGLYVSYADLESGKAKSGFAPTPAYFSEPNQDVEVEHMVCPKRRGKKGPK